MRSIWWMDDSDLSGRIGTDCIGGFQYCVMFALLAWLPPCLAHSKPAVLFSCLVLTEILLVSFWLPKLLSDFEAWGLGHGILNMVLCGFIIHPSRTDRTEILWAHWSGHVVYVSASLNYSVNYCSILTFGSEIHIMFLSFIITDAIGFEQAIFSLWSERLNGKIKSIRVWRRCSQPAYCFPSVVRKWDSDWPRISTVLFCRKSPRLRDLENWLSCRFNWSDLTPSRTEHKFTLGYSVRPPQ